MVMRKTRGRRFTLCPVVRLIVTRRGIGLREIAHAIGVRVPAASRYLSGKLPLCEQRLERLAFLLQCPKQLLASPVRTPIECSALLLAYEHILVTRTGDSAAGGDGQRAIQGGADPAGHRNVTIGRWSQL